jgi:hypothetical protein
MFADYLGFKGADAVRADAGEEARHVTSYGIGEIRDGCELGWDLGYVAFQRYLLSDWAGYTWSRKKG